MIRLQFFKYSLKDCISAGGKVCLAAEAMAEDDCCHKNKECIKRSIVATVHALFEFEGMEYAGRLRRLMSIEAMESGLRLIAELRLPTLFILQ